MSEFSQNIEPWIEFWAAGLWRASWQGAIVLGGVWAIARGCKLFSPRVVCWLWRLACLKLLLALFWAQPVRLAILPAEPRAPAAGESAFLPASGATAAPASSRAEVELPPAPRATAEHGGVNPRVWLFALWLAGVSYSMGGIVRQWKSARRLLTSATGEVSDALREICRQEATRLRVRRPPRLRLSSRVDSPLLAGIWRPTIVLPAWCGQESRAAFDIGELRLMLAHELAHHRRRDLLWNWLPAAVRAVFFFHPLVWLMVRRWCEAQEAACDELLIQGRLAQPVEYGRLLLKVAARESLHSQPGLAAAGVLGAYRDLETRILTMTRVRPYSFRRLAVAAGVLSLIAVSGLIPWRFAPRMAALAAGPDSHDESEAAEPPERLPGKIYVWVNLKLKSNPSVPSSPDEYRGVISIDPNTGSWERVGPIGERLRMSPDGRRAAFARFRESAPGVAAFPLEQDVFVTDLLNPQPTLLVEGASLPMWSPDGRQVLYHIAAKKADPNRGDDAGWHGTAWAIDLTTKEKQNLPIPVTDEVDDWSPHGNWLVTVSDRHPPFGRGYQLYLMHPDGTDERRITTRVGGLNVYPRFSPDGKQIVYNHQRRGEDSLWIVDLDGALPKRLAISEDERDAPSGACWSPDGRWLAVRLHDWQKSGGPETYNWRLQIIAVDGARRQVLALKDVAGIEYLQIPAEWR